MKKSFSKILKGYNTFREKYAQDDQSVMQQLAYHGQKPTTMVVACCDSRVDPGLILQCDPGDLFVARNVANIVPPYQKDGAYHGVSAALEFGIRFLKVKNLILWGHSQCGGIQALLENKEDANDDFITRWVSILKSAPLLAKDVDTCAQEALKQSYQNCLTFPWIQEKVREKELDIHLWFFDIKTGEILTYSEDTKSYQALQP